MNSTRRRPSIRHRLILLPCIEHTFLEFSLRSQSMELVVASSEHILLSDIYVKTTPFARRLFQTPTQNYMSSLQGSPQHIVTK